ncbi:MAG: glycosyltransferase [Gemmatimonadaceae bacterium]
MFDLGSVASNAVRATDVAILFYFIGLNTFYLVLFALALPDLWRHVTLSDDVDERARLLSSEGFPPITIIVPAYNEEVSIVESVLALLTLDYPRHEVVLVNDGSTDGTLERLIVSYDLYEVPPSIPLHIRTAPLRAYYRSRLFSKLLVLDKENGTKADALNAAINAARFPFVLAVDADTIIAPDALQRVARPILLGEDVAAVSATLRVANACRIEHGRVTDARVDARWLPGCQVVEYLRAFLVGRTGWNALGGNPIISGAFGLFKRQYLLAIGGYKVGNVTEDFDLVVRLRRYLRDNGIRATLPYIPDPVAWTEVPSTLRILARQRERWHRGLVGTIMSHWDVLLNPRYGPFGTIAFPFLVFGEMCAPVVELLGYAVTLLGLAFGLIDWEFAGLFFAVALGFGIVLSFLGILLEEVSFRRYTRWRDLGRLFAYAVVESIGFRQMTVWFRLRAFVHWWRGSVAWGVMVREGFDRRAAEKPKAKAA